MKNYWATAHIRLKRLYDERITPVMSQREFGKLYGIGSQPMVSQYLTGERPLNYKAAGKFARGLGCTIYDICPEMAEELMPVLGKTLRRAAVLLLCTITQLFTPSDANAAGFNITNQPSAFIRQVPDLNTHWASRLRRWLERFLAPALHILTPFRTAR